ncbi:hypothetical protein R6Q59_009898 [Mikania micrantha]
MSRTTSGEPFRRPLAFSNKSFTRYEPSSPTSPTTARSRASTLNTPVVPRKSQEDERKDVFNKSETAEDETFSHDLSRTNSLPEQFDELPIELASLTDRFVESLGAKSWDQPPSIDQISDLFQEFYITASSRISIHISSLITRLNREPSPKPSRPTPRSRTLSTKKSNESLKPDKADGAQQMLTATEVTEKRKARKLLEYKRLLLEEAVERRACEKVYSGIWRHKSTLDEVRDEKLRSKTAALALVGIGLKDLGIELDSRCDKTVEDVQELLTPARDGLIRMNEEHYPLGKLQQLTSAHKAIVDTLYSIHGSSSSADEILPTLIYTLVTAPVEGINIISNLNFIQRFRASTKIDGESAYCMTNLEAAISFLENVDLSTLRAEERPEGPPKTPSQPSTPMLERNDPFPLLPPTTTLNTSNVQATSDLQTSGSSTSLSLKLKSAAVNDRPLASPRHQRTLSDLLQPVTAANEAVRNSAKEGIESISNTLDNSLKFLFGRLKEQQADPTSPKAVIVPRTIDEARQLVSKPVGPDAADEAIAASDTSSVADKDTLESPATERSKTEDKLLALFGGKRSTPMTRERSADSQKSSGSGSRRLALTPANQDNVQKSTATNPSSQTHITPLDSVKNIGSSLNPLNHIGNAFGGGFRGFSRPALPMTAVLSTSKPAEQQMGTVAKDAKKPDSMQADSESIQILVDEPEQIAKKIREVKPPIARFIDTNSAADLKLGDVGQLLSDYKRLANLLRELAQSEK